MPALLSKIFSEVNLGTLFKIPVKLNWSFFLLIILSLITSGPSDAFTVTLTLFSVLGHELSHSLVAKKLGIEVKEITLYYFGGIASINLKDNSSSHDELSVAMAGPIFSILLGLLLLSVKLTPFVFPAIVPMLGLINLVIGFGNLMPIFPLDGGRILRSLLKMKWGYIQATKASLIVARVLGFILLANAIIFVHQLIIIAAIINILTFAESIRFKSETLLPEEKRKINYPSNPESSVIPSPQEVGHENK